MRYRACCVAKTFERRQSAASTHAPAASAQTLTALDSCGPLAAPTSRPSATAAPARAVGTLLFVAACLLAAMLLLAAPAPAFAKSYDMTKVDISAQAATNGALHVTEQRTFEFDGTFSAVWWTFDGLPSNAKLQIDGMRMAHVGEDGAVQGEWQTLPSVPFVLEWRDAGGPGSSAYSFDSPKNTVYAFFDVTDERVIIELDYTVVNGVQAYSDVAEVYWKYVGDQWEEESLDVSMTLALPVPQGVEVVPGDNVRAWGHGPLDGSLSVNADGTVTYEVPRVNAGQYAEARVVFPVKWLTNLSAESASAHSGTQRLSTVLSQEEAWADQANRQRTTSLLLVIACCAACVLVLAWAVLMFVRHGKEHEPDFKEEYWRDVPDRNMHPAVIARLWRWDRESQDDFTATLMHLSHIGAVQINKGVYEKPGSFGRTKQVEDYYLTRVPAVANAVSDPVDRAALRLLFDTIAKGDSLWFATINLWGEEHPQEFAQAMESWQGTLSGQVNRCDFFEMKAERLQGVMLVLAVAVVAAGFFALLSLENFLLFVFAVPTAIALAIIANYMPRRSVPGNNLVAKCKALRNWLRDFSSLDERPPTDVKVWGEFMVYAYIFGIAEQVIKALRIKVPELFVDDAMMGRGYVPWWVWYSPGPHGGLPPVGDALRTTLSNTESVARAALSAAEDNFSSGGGFGGGFSVGGGGGFGGGGGAR